jgi:hypothetical protein
MMTARSQDAMASLRSMILSRPNAPTRITFAEVIIEAERICRTHLGITQPDMGDYFSREEKARA